MNGELDGLSLDVKAEKLGQLKNLFPEFFAEGKLDVSSMTQLLGDDDIATKDHYELSWAGKAEARREIQKRTSATLKPDRERSINFDTSENVFVEGENLEVLRTLQKAYFGKVKMIYIDPPYNTGSDNFVYPDDYSERLEEYQKRTGVKNGDGYLNKLDLFKTNTRENGQYHSVWLSMMYPRLYLARNLLREDGVIFVSIDDNEVHNLRHVMNEIFGEENFEGHIHWRRRHNQPNDKTKMIGLVAEHILAYSKNKEFFKRAGVGKIDLTGSFSNPDSDPRGDWASKPWKVGSDQSGSRYTITNPNTNVVYDEEWMGDETTYKALVADNRIYFPRNGEGLPRKKYFRSERLEEGQCATNWWNHTEFGHNQGANDEMTSLFGVKNIFSNPKPKELIRGLLQISNTKGNDLVLDFFAGSGTTAHAVLALNREDGENRKFVCVQMPETLEVEAAAKAAGYTTIADVCRARISKVINSLHEENNGKMDFAKNNIDLGFRSYTLTYSNFKQWKTHITDNAELLKQLEDFKEPLFKKPDDSFDLLTELLLKFGVPLSARTEKRTTVDDVPYFVVEGHSIYALDRLSPELLKDVEAIKPAKFLTLGNLFTGEKADETMTNWRLQLTEAGIDFTLI